LDATATQPIAVGMDIFEAIRTRRSKGKMTDQVPPREAIEQILEAATWAPNHHVTEPWRFVVVAGAAREALGAVMAQSKIDRRLAEGKVSPDGEFEALKRKALRSPVIVAVAVEPGAATGQAELEEIEAGAAAVQNMLLTAHGLGLAAMWRSGDAATDPNVRAHLGFSERATIVGFVYLGYPAAEPTRSRHTPASAFTTWRGWDDD
jgi:nitroreductase